MPKEIKGLIVSRLVVLISIILVPVAIFLIFNLVDFKLWFSDDPALNFWILNILCPLVFSVSWLFFLILFANRFAATIEAMDRTVGVVPLRLRFFFGLNALFILFIFVFPIITPIISILSFASMAWRLTTSRKESWDDSKVSFGTKLLMILFSLLPIFCTIVILPQYILLSIFLWENIWIPLLPIIFIISVCLCTALAIGSLFFLIANKGVSEYEQILKEEDEEARILEVSNLLTFAYLQNKDWDKSLNLLSELKEKYPDNPVYLLNIASVYKNGMKDLAKTIDVLRELIERFPSNERLVKGAQLEIESLQKSLSKN